MRRIALGVAAACALAGCATPTNTVYQRPVTSVISPPVSSAPNIYTNAAHAPLHSELFACANRGSNLGLIGLRGEASNYTPYIDTPAGPLLRTPTEVACLSSGFGWRGGDRGRQHSGLDLANPNGGFIYAAGDGRIAAAEWRGAYGNYIEIDHGDGVRTRYAHMAEIDSNLRPGMRIASGTPMGRMGMTGNATGVHLHYEVMVDGLLVDPLNYGAPAPFITTPVTQTYTPQPRPIETTPVTQTYAEPLPIDPAPVEPAPAEAPASQQTYPEIIRLQPPR